MKQIVFNKKQLTEEQSEVFVNKVKEFIDYSKTKAFNVVGTVFLVKEIEVTDDTLTLHLSDMITQKEFNKLKADENEIEVAEW